MPIDRRTLLAGLAATATPSLARAAAPISTLGLDAAQLGVRAGSPDDQTKALQRAIDQAAAARVPLALAPGVYRAGDLVLPAGAQIVGIRGATRLVSTRGRPLFTAPQADRVTLDALVLDGAGTQLPGGLGLVALMNGRGVRITDCEIDRRRAATASRSKASPARSSPPRSRTPPTSPSIRSTPAG